MAKNYSKKGVAPVVYCNPFELGKKSIPGGDFSPPSISLSKKSVPMGGDLRLKGFRPEDKIKNF
jgi:hypothetical protein